MDRARDLDRLIRVGRLRCVPCVTLQYPQERVQVSPRIMNVAVP